MEEEFNPYAAPKAGDMPCPEGAADIRKRHLRTESSLKGLGVVMAVSGVMVVLAAAGQGVSIAEEFGVSQDWLTARRLSVPVFAMGFGIGLWCLARWAWCGAIVLYLALGFQDIMDIPQGLFHLMVHTVILCLLLLPKSRRVMAADYPSIILATGEMRSALPFWAKWFGGLAAFAASAYAIVTFF
ncbi:MAG: hypothetical protein ACO1TE_29700 [Prosthecobacter sp.]